MDKIIIIDTQYDFLDNATIEDRTESIIRLTEFVKRNSNKMWPLHCGIPPTIDSSLLNLLPSRDLH
jgi:hypothetical protein